MFRSHLWKFAVVATTGVSLFVANQSVAWAQFSMPKAPKFNAPKLPAFKPPSFPKFPSSGPTRFQGSNPTSPGRRTVSPSIPNGNRLGTFAPPAPFVPRSQAIRTPTGSDRLQGVRRPPVHHHPPGITGSDVIGLIGTLAPLIAQPPQERPQRYRDYEPERQVIYQTQPVYQSPPAKPKVAPPKNPIVARKPVSNAKFELTNLDHQHMSAELNARQDAEYASAGGKMDAALTQAVTGASVSDPIVKKEMEKAWRDAVLSGDPAQFEQFRDQYGKYLKPFEQDVLDTRVMASMNQRDLRSGLLSQDEIDNRVQEFRNRVNGWQNSPIKTGVLANVAEIDKFNELGKLADLVQGTANPLETLVDGFESAGCDSEMIAEVTGLPIMTESPTADSTQVAAEIMLRNPVENGQDISYSLGGHTYTMKPGERQSLSQTYVLSFDPGDGSAAQETSLETGVYHFVLSGHAWKLEKVTPRVKIDNSRYAGTFNYLLNGQPMALAPGQVVEHTDSSAIVIEFDRGDAGTPARKMLTSGTFEVGINAANQTLDLYEVSAKSTTTTFVGTPQTPQVSKQRQIEEAINRLKANKK